MKINKLSVVAFVAMTALTNTSFAADPDHLNLPIARTAVTRLKAEAVALRAAAAVGLAPDVLALGRATAAGDGDYAAYLGVVLPPLRLALIAAFEGWGAANNTVILHGGTTTARRQRDEFRDDLLVGFDTIDTALITGGGHGGAVAIPADGRLDTLTASKADIVAKINTVMGETVDALIGGAAGAGGDATAATVGAFIAGGAINRGALKALIAAVVNRM